MKVRTPREMEEQAMRTLYIRLPHTIKNMDEIRELVFDEAEIRLPRQSTRHCHVIFPSVEVKMKNLKALKKKLIDNKKIFVSKPRQNEVKEKRLKKVKERKVKPKIVEKPKPQSKITKICFVKNIPLEATLDEVKGLFKEAKNVALLAKHHNSDKYQLAIVKFKDLKSAAAYLNKEKPLPKLGEAQLEISSDKRKQKKKKVKTEVKTEEEIKSESDEGVDSAEGEEEESEGDEDEDDDEAED